MMRKDRTGMMLVICAPSGTGKTTLTRRLLKEFARLTYSVSYTTRPPRANEVHGRDYFFTTTEHFIELRDQGFFAEWAQVHGSQYGTPLKATRDLLEQGRDVIFDIDVHGALQLKSSLGANRGCFVFVMPPSYELLEQRLHSRGTDDASAIKRRMINAMGEMQQAHWFDAWIVNDDLDRAYDELRSVYLAAALAPACWPGLVESILEGWRMLLEMEHK